MEIEKNNFRKERRIFEKKEEKRFKNIDKKTTKWLNKVADNIYKIIFLKTFQFVFLPRRRRSGENRFFFCGLIGKKWK